MVDVNDDVDELEQHDVQPTHNLLEDLKKVEQLAAELVAVNDRLRLHAHGAFMFYAVNLGAEGLAHWRKFLRENYGIDW